MAIDGLSGAIYHDSAKTAPKPKVDSNGNSQNTSAMNISVTEIPAVDKPANSNQLKDQEKGQKENATASEQQIRDAISKANNKMKAHRTRCEFSYHEETRRVSIKVLDKDTEEVIREIPPEETLDMIQRMWELEGLLIDEKR